MKIDQHNRSRQDNLMIEKKYVVLDWDRRVNLSILSVIIVDAWNVYNVILQDDCEDTENEFYTILADEMIDNILNMGGVRTKRMRSLDGTPSPNLIHPDGSAANGVGAHLTPTKKRRRTKDDMITPYSAQLWCD